jgi:hypothetical protein
MKKLLSGGLLLFAAACQDGRTATSIVDAGQVPAGNVQLVIQQQPASGDSAVFIVRVIGHGVPVAAYQGAVTFLPGGMDVTSVSTPEAQNGEYRVVNSGDASSGRIRFAGFATGDMQSTEAFRIVARVHTPLAALKLQGVLDVVGQATGMNIAPDHLKPSDGVFDAVTNIQLQ